MLNIAFIGYFVIFVLSKSDAQNCIYAPTCPSFVTWMPGYICDDGFFPTIKKKLVNGVKVKTVCCSEISTCSSPQFWCPQQQLFAGSSQSAAALAPSCSVGCVTQWKTYENDSVPMIDGLSAGFYTSGVESFIGRVRVVNGYLPGRIHPNQPGMFYAYSGLERYANGSVEFLYSNPNYTYQWISSENGSTVANAVTLNAPKSSAQYIGRISVNGGTFIGTVVRILGGMFYSDYSGVEQFATNYDVLVCNKPSVSAALASPPVCPIYWKSTPSQSILTTPSPTTLPMIINSQNGILTGDLIHTYSWANLANLTANLITDVTPASLIMPGGLEYSVGRILADGNMIIGTVDLNTGIMQYSDSEGTINNILCFEVLVCDSALTSTVNPSDSTTSNPSGGSDTSTVNPSDSTTSNPSGGSDTSTVNPSDSTTSNSSGGSDTSTVNPSDSTTSNPSGGSDTSTVNPSDSTTSNPSGGSDTSTVNPSDSTTSNPSGGSDTSTVNPSNSTTSNPSGGSDTSTVNPSDSTTSNPSGGSDTSTVNPSDSTTSNSSGGSDTSTVNPSDSTTSNPSGGSDTSTVNPSDSTTSNPSGGSDTSTVNPSDSTTSNPSGGSDTSTVNPSDSTTSNPSGGSDTSTVNPSDSTTSNPSGGSDTSTVNPSDSTTSNSSGGSDTSTVNPSDSTTSNPSGGSDTSTVNPSDSTTSNPSGGSDTSTVNPSDSTTSNPSGGSDTSTVNPSDSTTSNPSGGSDTSTVNPSDSTTSNPSGGSDTSTVIPLDSTTSNRSVGWESTTEQGTTITDSTISSEDLVTDTSTISTTVISTSSIPPTILSTISASSTTGTTVTPSPRACIVTWQDYTGDEDISEVGVNAVLAGSSAGYVGQGNIYGNILPGRIVATPDDTYCYYFGVEGCLTSFQYLENIHDYTYNWINSHNGEYVEDAIMVQAFYIGRILSNSHLHLGTVVPSYGMVYYDNIESAWHYSNNSYQVLTCDPTPEVILYDCNNKWAPYENNLEPQTNGVYTDDENSTFVGRTTENKDYLVGRVQVTSPSGLLHLTSTGSWSLDTVGVEYLLRNDTSSYQWIDSSYGQPVEHAVSIRKSSSFWPMYIGRVQHNSTYQYIGRVLPAQGLQFHDGNPVEDIITHYQVLTCTSTIPYDCGCKK